MGLKRVQRDMNKEKSTKPFPDCRALKVVFLPQTEIYAGNPYWEQLQAKLEQIGVEFVQTDDKLYLQWRWLVQNRHRVDVIHFHFLQHHYAVNEKSASAGLLMKFIAKLILAKLLGYRLVWTVHNLYHHEKLYPEYIGRLAHLAMAHLADAVIVHCEHARQALADKFYRRKNVYTTFHPSYIGIYPDIISRKEARAKLHLSEHQRVILFLGTIRAYKGVDQLIQAFRRISGEELVLLIAGKLWHTMSEAQFQALSLGDKRIVFVPHYIPDMDLQNYYKAADAVILPFTNVLSSGSALLAMSFGCPVIAPAIGCLAEVITPDTGVVYDPREDEGLYKALLHALSQDLKDMGENAYKRATQFTWDDMAGKTLQVYRSAKAF